MVKNQENGDRTYWNICDICDQIVAKAILRADMVVCIPCLSYIEFDEDEWDV